jgi:hypothetical protein
MKPILRPVWIKYYGLIPMTRRGYLLTLGIVCAVALAIVLAAAALGGLPPLDTMWSRQHHMPGSGFLVVLHNYMYWFVLACLAAQAVDTWCTLRVFARAEARQWAQLDPGSQSGTSETVSEYTG